MWGCGAIRGSRNSATPTCGSIPARTTMPTWRVSRQTQSNLFRACSFRSLRPRIPEFAQRHPGRATIEVVTLAPYGWFERWAERAGSGAARITTTLKQSLAARLRTELERHVPAVRGKIDYCELSTPLSTASSPIILQGQVLNAWPDRPRRSSASARGKARRQNRGTSEALHDTSNPGRASRSHACPR